MKKNEIAPALLVLAASLAQQAYAQSSVNLYGTADVYLGHSRQTGAVAASDPVLNSGALTPSFLGVQGSEDLGGGLRSVFSLEAWLRADTGAIGRTDADPFWSRHAVVGLESSSWGRVTLGRNVAPYSVPVFVHTPFVGSVAFGTAFTHVYRNNLLGDTRFNNSIRYTSPGGPGWGLDLAWTLGQEINAGANRHRERGWDGVVKYTGAAWSVSTGTRQINLNENNNGREQKAYLLAASYDLRVVQFHGQLHRVRETLTVSTANATRKTSELGLTVPIGAGKMLATVARSRMDDAIAATPARRQSWSLGYDHNLSKRTDVYLVAIGHKLRRPDATQRQLGVGIRHRF